MKLVRAGIWTGAMLMALTSAREARAEGYSVARFGGEHGHPTTTNATAIYYNPAGIGMSEGYHVFVDGNFAWRRVTYEHETEPTDDQNPNTPDGANNGKATLMNILASPMIGVTGKFGDVALGAGFYTPFGGRGVWQKNDQFENNPNFAGPYDGTQRWYAISGEITSSFVTLAGAYHIKPARLAIGVGANLILSTTNTVRAKTTDGSNDLASEGRSHLDVHGLDWSLGVGVLYEAIEKQLWLGASYQSRPNLTGMKPQEGKFRFYANGQESVNADAELDTDLPDTIRLGTRYRPQDDLELRLFGHYMRWSVIDRQCVHKPDQDCEPNSSAGDTTFFDQPRDWNDTFNIRAGVSKWVSKPVEVFAGAGYASNAVPDSTMEPSLADWNSVSFGLGGRFEIFEKAFVAASYTQLFYIPRDTQGKFDLDEPPNTGVTANPDAGGKYKQMVGVLNVNVDFQF
jgi:long-chain fatty acid transport protein